MIHATAYSDDHQVMRYLGKMLYSRGLRPRPASPAHLKWEARGKRRIHAKPSRCEMVACRPWLDAEIAVVEPRVLVCLGATAAQAVIGRDFRVSRQRGELVDSALAPYVTATIHPSAILRQRDDESRRLELEAFVDDLRKVAELL